MTRDRIYTPAQQGAEEFERARLALLEQVCDLHTIGQLGSSGGWRCLDVGAGGGSVTGLLAERVGDTGSAVSLDFDVHLLEPLASVCVEVPRHERDPGYGGRMIGDPEALDLADLAGEVVTRLARGNAVHPRLFADSLSRLDESRSLGANHDDIAKAQRRLRDPGAAFRTATITTAWGRGGS